MNRIKRLKFEEERLNKDIKKMQYTRAPEWVFFVFVFYAYVRESRRAGEGAGGRKHTGTRTYVHGCGYTHARTRVRMCVGLGLKFNPHTQRAHTRSKFACFNSLVSCALLKTHVFCQNVCPHTESTRHITMIVISK